MSTVIVVSGHARSIRNGREQAADAGASDDADAPAGADATDATDAADALTDAVRQAAEVVARGGLVVVPTDTVYGVGADAFDAAAVAELLAAKGRGREAPPPVLVPDKRTIDGLATQVPEYARRLVDRYWPGPLTLVLRAQASLRWDLGDTNGTVAVRMPDDEATLSLLAETGPLAVSSANRHGEPAATTAAEARAQLGESVDLYLDGGPSSGGAASTIVDCTKDEPVVLRQGALDAQEVLDVARGDGDAPSDTAASGGQGDGQPVDDHGPAHDHGPDHDHGSDPHDDHGPAHDHGPDHGSDPDDDRASG